jgi:hypothetical protein
MLRLIPLCERDSIDWTLTAMHLLYNKCEYEFLFVFADLRDIELG